MTTVTLTGIGSKVTIYAGSVLFSLGFTGNIVTIYVLRSTRRSPLTFILIALSIANCISLCVGLLNRVVVTSIGIDPTLLSPEWCRLRVFIGQTAVLLCQSCSCLASINCFLSSCRQVRWRRFVSLSVSRWSVFIAVVVWIIHGLFNPLLTELLIATGKSRSCTLTSAIASSYTGFFIRPILIGFGPISILSTFGILTHRNLKQMHSKHRTERFTISKMLLYQMIANCIGTAPYGIFYMYQSMTSAIRMKTAVERAQENAVLDFINIIFYMPQSSPLYVYYFSSKVFKAQVKAFFPCLRGRSIRPISTATVGKY